MAITHGECGKTWTGHGRAHCSGCHETFNSYRGSDRHRIGAHGVDRHCTDPAAVGLVRRADGIWYQGEPGAFVFGG